jgi:hypothetical protein
LKTTKKQFERFKELCHKYIDAYDLNSWHIYYAHKQLEDVNYGAECCPEISSHTAWVNFNTESISGHSDEELDRFAKHEILHILVSSVSELIYERFISKSEVARSIETLVVKLEGLL